MTIAYIDTSAIGKTLVTEPESSALGDYLDTLEPGDLFSSVLLETELRRMATRHSLPQSDVTEILTRVSLVSPERDFFHRAGILPGRHLRSLDALHLVTALEVGAETVLSYDQRMIDSAALIGLPTTTPA
jgi:predicted nucleic acid-binding protein